MQPMLVLSLLTNAFTPIGTMVLVNTMLDLVANAMETRNKTLSLHVLASPFLSVFVVEQPPS